MCGPVMEVKASDRDSVQLLLAQLELEKALEKLVTAQQEKEPPPKREKKRRIRFADAGTRALIKNILEKKFNAARDVEAVNAEYKWDCSILVNHDIDDESFISVSKHLPGRLERDLLSAKFKALQRATAMTQIMAFPENHDDLVTVVEFNYFGTRILTAGADHRMSVMHRYNEASLPKLQDTWTAHDAEITDVSCEVFAFVNRFRSQDN